MQELFQFIIQLKQKSVTLLLNDSFLRNFMTFFIGLPHTFLIFILGFLKRLQIYERSISCNEIIQLSFIQEFSTVTSVTNC